MFIYCRFVLSDHNKFIAMPVRIFRSGANVHVIYSGDMGEGHYRIPTHNCRFSFLTSSGVEKLTLSDAQNIHSPKPIPVDEVQDEGGTPVGDVDAITTYLDPFCGAFTPLP